MRTESTDFWKLFKAGACALRLEGQSKEAVFEEILAVLVKAGHLDEELSGAALTALVKRETMASTGVGMNVAIPHVELPGLEKAVTSLGIHPEGVEWDALDGESVKLFFMVLRPAEGAAEHDSERHLEMMRWISRLGREGDFRRFAIRAKTRTELIDLLKEMSAV